MNAQKIRSIFVLLFLILASCSLERTGAAENQTLALSTETPRLSTLVLTTQAQPTNPPTPTQTPTPTTRLPTATSTPTIVGPSFAPTLNSTQEHKMAGLLSREDCELPCYLGITPGKTSWEEARAILVDLRTGDPHRMKITEENGWPIYTYSLTVGDLLSPHPTPHPYIFDWLVSHGVDFTIGDGRVERMQIWVVPTPLDREKYRTYWLRRYSLAQTLHRLGKPDAIYFTSMLREGASYTIILVYEDVSAVIYYYILDKNWHNHMACPLLAEEISGLSMTSMILTNPASPLDIYAPDQPPVFDPSDIYETIEEGWGVSVDEFFNRLSQDPSICFEVKEIKDHP